ncbi:MAG: hypothetical protein ACMUJM_23470 [bacterium]
MNNELIKKIASFVVPATLLFTIGGCIKARHRNPLKNTKALVKEGHVSLYKNGAFGVPNTSIRLIPPGPSALDIAGEMMGLRARQSFTESVKKAAESIYIISEGTELTFKVSKEAHEKTHEISDAIKRMTRKNSLLLIKRSSTLGKSIIGKSWESSKYMIKQRKHMGESVAEESLSLGKKLGDKGTKQGIRFMRDSEKHAGQVVMDSTERAAEALGYAKKSFIVGYATVPKKLKEKTIRTGKSIKDADLLGHVKKEDNRRLRRSKQALNLLVKTFKEYGENVKESFRKAGKELRNSSRLTGVSLAILKSARWALQGLMWDATIKPIANVSAASVGYIYVNCIAFPTMIVAREGKSTAYIAAEASWNVSKTAYDLIAPSGIAAVACIYSLLDLTGSNLYAGTTMVAGSTIGASEVALSKTASIMIQSSGYAVGKGIQYVGVPLAAVGVSTGGGTVGTVIGSIGATSGGTIYVLGETAYASGQVFGNVIAGSGLVAGTAASVTAGSAYGVYELSKAVAVPTGYEVGGGVVLGYGTLSHLGSHSILAVADCSYMVLSLEGPRWILYAIKGKIKDKKDEEDMSVGTIVDLQKIRESGEELYYLPVSDEEMKNVVNSVYENLPVSSHCP